MAFFSDTFIQDVMDKNDIVSTVSRYVNLKRSGSSMKGLCPFHKEKTPSFSVSADKQMFYCFGCGKGGTVIHFTMETENLDFVEAVKLLAERAGLDIPDETQNDSGQSTQIRKMIYKLNADAGRFYYECLNADCGIGARQYANKRCLEGGTVNRFGIGYAPDGNRLLEHLRAKGYDDDIIVKSGVAGKSDDGRIYDRFRNRLMFPIIDIRRNIIGFGGRILDEGNPKYLNSPETPAFNKSCNLYGLNFAKNSKEDFFILVEGYMDVIALHQSGFTMAVATLGTALTPEQARLIKRHRETVIISYDSDEAGQKATRRAIEILTDEGLNVKVLTMEGSKDPDEFIKKNGTGAYRECINKAQVQTEYKIAKLKEKYNLEDSHEKVLYIGEISAEFMKIKSPVEREIYVKKIAMETGVSADSIFGEINRLSAAASNAEKFKNFKNNPGVKNVDKNEMANIALNNSRKLILHILFHNRNIAEELFPVLVRDDFDDENMQLVYDEIDYCLKSNLNMDIMRVIEKSSNAPVVSEILMDDKQVGGNKEVAARQSLDMILKYRQKKELIELLKDDNVSGDERLARINQQLMEKRNKEENQ